MRFLWDRAISKWVIASCDCFEQEYGYVQFQFVRDCKDVDDFNVVEDKDSNMNVLQQGVISSS